MADGHAVLFHDLYSDGFDPVLTADEALTSSEATDPGLVQQVLDTTSDATVIKHRNEIAEAQGLVVVHPNWWGKPPAILSGWLDRVLVPGVAYRHDEQSNGLVSTLQLRAALIINTSDTSLQEQAEIGDPLESIWMRSVLPFCGAPRSKRLNLSPVVDSSSAQRISWLGLAVSSATDLFS